MSNVRINLCAVLAALGLSAPIAAAQQAASPNQGHYAFVWTGAADPKAMDFLAVIDVDPASPSYGKLITTLATDQPTMQVHHTEYVMPEGGMLFANDHMAGRTFVFDLREPTHPKIAADFRDRGGFAFPHSFVRLPNGHVLSTFMHRSTGMPGMAMAPPYDHSGGLVEMDAGGKLIRASSSEDPAFSTALLSPYSLVVLPKIDRVLSTNSAMDFTNGYGSTYQVWRLSDLKLLSTQRLDVGQDANAFADPQEPRIGPDGSVFVQTLACGIERITGLEDGKGKSKLVYKFPGGGCGVPSIVGHYLVQSVPVIHGLIVIDIAKPEKPVEVSRVTFGDNYAPHWTAWDAKTGRLAVTASTPGDTHMMMVKLDATTGKLSLDAAFKDEAGAPGFTFSGRSWPHGWTGDGVPHGVVFQR